jgi:hypothetical protein
MQGKPYASPYDEARPVKAMTGDDLACILPGHVTDLRRMRKHDRHLPAFSTGHTDCNYYLKGKLRASGIKH